MYIKKKKQKKKTKTKNKTKNKTNPTNKETKNINSLNLKPEYIGWD